MADDPKVLPPEEFEREVDGLASKMKQQRKRKNVAIIVSCLAVVLAAVAGGIALNAQEGSQTNEDEVTDLSRKVNINADRLEDTAKKLEEQTRQFEYCKKAPKNDPKCQRPVAPPTNTATPERPEEPSDPAITSEDVRRIVGDEVARRNLTLTAAQVNTVAAAVRRTIPTPKDGRTPTEAELRGYSQAAVATFCANDACKGNDGTDGTDGNDGEDGTDGADAPAPTEDQLVAAVAAFCGRESQPCKGDKGDKGDQGDAGGKGDKGDSLSVEAAPVEGGTRLTFTSTNVAVSPVTIFVPDGKPGKDAFPFTFGFSVPGTLPTDPNRTYKCTVTDPATPVDCELQPS